MHIAYRSLFAVMLLQMTWLPQSFGLSFSFESINSLAQMRIYLEENVPLNTKREMVRQLFIQQAGANLHIHPQRPNVEKYAYDINLCKSYIWRWNISANFGKAGNLSQVYLNGEPVHGAGDILRDPTKLKLDGANAQIHKATKPRPEASNGETKITYLLYNINTDVQQVDNLFIIGSGPSRPHPDNLGKMHVYESVEHWRSIFDEQTEFDIMKYSGKCPN